MAQEQEDAEINQPAEDEDEKWVNEINALMPEECENLEELIWPVKRMLAKVIAVQYGFWNDIPVCSDCWSW